MPDAIALVGAVGFIIAENHITAKYFELIRILHLNEALYLVYYLIQTYSNMGQKRIIQISQFIFVFFLFIIIGHLSACLWIFMG